MSLLIDSPTGGRPPKLKGVMAKGFVLLLLGVPVSGRGLGDDVLAVVA